MKNYIARLAVILFCSVLIMLAGCGREEEKQKAAETTTTQTQAQPIAPPAGDAPKEPAIAEKLAAAPLPKATMPTDIIVEVNGAKLTYGQLEGEAKKKLAVMKGKIPADKKKQVRDSLNKSLINEFIGRTLLTEEISKQKIAVSGKEVDEAIEKMKSTLPPDVTIDDLLKRNKVTKAKMREEIRFTLQIDKLVIATTGSKTKPSEKEIADFYEKNKDKFQMPESARARHVLVAKAAGDDDKVKAEKKARAEAVRKQLVEGADFADIAKKSSDCPSREFGGDLGVFSRGQMVKPFDDAVFSQKINEIGPIVETDFGFHIIQVLERNPSKVMPLEGETKDRIVDFLEKQKKQEAFANLMKKLQDKAKIVMHKQP